MFNFDLSRGKIFVFMPAPPYLCRPGKKNRFYPEKGQKF